MAEIKETEKILESESPKTSHLETGREFPICADESYRLCRSPSGSLHCSVICLRTTRESMNSSTRARAVLLCSS